MHSIENEFLRVNMREFGAELTSVFDKVNKVEHLWQADEKYWGWHAPVLFPVVGRCLNDQVAINGKTYDMEKHGFARKSDFGLLELNEQKAVFSLSDSLSSLAIYPYRFEFLISYRLDGRSLICSYEVINKDQQAIYFCLGGHPAFSAPFLPGELYEDYFLEFEHPENVARHYIDKDGFFDGRTEQVIRDSKILPLNRGMFSDDAYIFKDLRSRKVTLKGKTNPHSVTVSFDGFNYLGLWAKVGAPYVCIEPWLGCADTVDKSTQFSAKEGVISLPVGQRFNRSIGVEIG